VKIYQKGRDQKVIIKRGENDGNLSKREREEKSPPRAQAIKLTL